MQSMTAFARVQRQLGHSLMVWEIRSVNHRYLEPSWRLPEPFRSMEPQLREHLRQKLARGKVECQLKISYPAESQGSLLFNQERVRTIIRAAEALHQEFGVSMDLTASQLLQMPEVLAVPWPAQDGFETEIMQGFMEAVTQLSRLRAQEGQAIVQMLQARIDAMGQHLDALQRQSARIAPQLRSKLLARLESLALEVGSQRIEQEIALLLQRMDVSEELDRLQAHCAQVTALFGSTQAVGRKLDFLMQELHREANTLSAKSDDVDLTRHAVEMKVLIEQMREQIQNIE
ncbi:MAG: YicC family protein [Legionellaceae bacterium]|nr:YicC family protein [Legionellaceae bacterium]